MNPDKSVVKVRALGDISLNGTFCDPYHHRAVKDNLSGIADQLGPADLTIGNFESPIWGKSAGNPLKMPRLATTVEAAECILPLRLDVAVLANNHAYDGLAEGFEKTSGFFDEHGICRLGAGFTDEEASRPIILARRGLTIGILAYVGEETKPCLPPDAGIRLNMLEPQRVLREVASLKQQADIVIVHLHWGADGLMQFPAPWKRKLGREVIEAGAALVIGGHSHCLQGDEPWQTGHIFYSMGHFIFGELPEQPGQWASKWPDFALKVATAEVELIAAGAEAARMVYFRQNGLKLQADNPANRCRERLRLGAPLSWNDQKLSNACRRETRRLFHKQLWTVIRDGGVWNLFKKIRSRHLKMTWHKLFP